MGAETPVPTGRQLNKNWEKSSYSQTSGCIEARLNGLARIAIRDSKDPNGPIIDIPTSAWVRLIKAIRNNQIGI